jgi:hypothetical protein
MKKAGILLLVLMALVIAAGGLYLAALRFDFNLEIPFIYRKSDSASRLMHLESREVLRLATVEYLYKSVFPHDFIPEETDFRQLFARLYRGEELTAEEERLAEVYRICVQIGIDPEIDQYKFAVITTRVKGGFDFSEAGIGIEEEAGGIIITLPEAVITELVIEDETSDGYEYPDIDAGPAAWKIITDLTREEIRKTVLSEGILSDAEKRGKSYLEMLFTQAGYERISFRTYPSKSE